MIIEYCDRNVQWHHAQMLGKDVEWQYILFSKEYSLCFKVRGHLIRAQ